MKDLASLFLNNLLPILLIAGIGFICGKFLKVEPKPVSRLIFYVFCPCLIFRLLTKSQLGGNDIFLMVVFAFFLVISMGLVTFALGKMLNLSRSMLAAVVLVVTSMNAGNFGLSLNLFAFGEAGLAQASIFYVTTALLSNSFGIAVASLGKSGIKDTLIRLVKVPMIYAVILALVFLRLEWQLPLPLDRTISVLGDASIPAMLILLGLQLQANHPSRHTSGLILANTMRLVGGIVFGLALGTLLNLQGVALQAGVTQAATPSAVISTVIATEFDTEPSFVTSVVFTSTILCPFTLTPLLAYLGA